MQRLPFYLPLLLFVLKYIFKNRVLNEMYLQFNLVFQHQNKSQNSGQNLGYPSLFWGSGCRRHCWDGGQVLPENWLHPQGKDARNQGETCTHSCSSRRIVFATCDTVTNDEKKGITMFNLCLNWRFVLFVSEPKRAINEFVHKRLSSLLCYLLLSSIAPVFVIIIDINSLFIENCFYMSSSVQMCNKLPYRSWPQI